MSRALVPIATMLVAAGCPAASEHSVEPDVADASIENPSGCPLVHPFLVDDLDFRCTKPGLTCLYAAPECDGTKPDNRCFCGGDQLVWDCSSPYQTCEPLAEDGRLAQGTRRQPAVVADACTTPAWDPSPTCRPSQGVSVDKAECASNGDCGPDRLCLDTHDFGGSSFCGCHQGACVTSDDCGEGFACRCGQTDSSARCDGWGPKPCHHRCVPALCRSNADCDEGGICAASPDVCGWQTERYACQYPDRPECLSNAECYHGAVCQYDVEAGGWRCVPTPVCE